MTRYFWMEISMSLVYRPARPQDLATTEALVVASINDLTERHGFGSMATVSPPNFQLFSLKDDPDGLWVAEDDCDILGFAWSWPCGDVWFLAQLFVDPAQQGRGTIGRNIYRAIRASCDGKLSSSGRIYAMIFSSPTAWQPRGRTR
jgi:hypothetical protein